LGLAESALARNCDNLKPNNPDPPIGKVIVQNASLGTVARPDVGAGTSLITLSPTGTRSIPPNLVINRDLTTPGRQPQAAAVQVTGGATCFVTITVIGTTGSLQGVTLRNTATGTTFSSGTRITLSNTGTFDFTIGVSQFVDSSTSTLGGTIQVQLNY
jgi:hypothetical protein